MSTVVRNVCDLDKNARRTIEHVVGQALHDGERVVIQVEKPPAQEQANTLTAADEKLPDWCNVYEDLSDEQIDELDKSITRSPYSREVPGS